MRTRNNPSCACCAECDIFDDNFSADNLSANYMTVSGTWSVAGGVLTTTSANALLVVNTAHPEGRAAHKLVVEIKADTAGQQFRVIVAYADSDNYLMVEVELIVGCGTMRLYRKSGGTLTQLGSDVVLDGAGLDQFHRLTVCYNEADEKLVGSFRALTTETTEYRRSAASTSGDQVAIGTSVNGGTMTLDALDFDSSEVDAETYPDTEYATCPVCTSDIDCTIWTGEPDLADTCLWDTSGSFNRLEVRRPVDTPEVKASLTFSTTSEGDYGEVHVDADDAGNSHSARLTVGAAGADGTLAIYRNGALLDSVTVSNCGAGADCEVHICFGGSPYPHVEGQGKGTGSLETVSETTTSNQGDKAGYEVSGATAGTFTYSLGRSDEFPDCPDCTVPLDCGFCLDGEMPDEYKVRLDGIVTSGIFGADECDCEILNVTHIVPMSGGGVLCRGINNSPPQACSDSSFQEKLEVLIFDSANSPDPSFPIGSGQYGVEVRMTQERGAINNHAGLQIMKWLKVYDEKPDCTNLFNEEIPYFGGGQECDATASSCFLTAI